MDDTLGTVDQYRGAPAAEVAAMFRKIDKVVPESVATELEAICQIEDRLQWKKGDLTNEIWKNVQGRGLKNKHGNPYTFLDVCFYVSAKYLRFSRSFNTVKAWALTARRYSTEVRLLYRSDELPFAHFAYAAKNVFDVDSSTGQKRWQDVLDYSLEQAGKLGRPIGVAELERHFEGVPKRQTVYQTGVYEFPSAETIFTPVTITDVDPAADPGIEVEYSEVLHSVSGVVTRMALKYPAYAQVIQQGFAMLSNVIHAIAERENEPDMNP